MGQAQGWTLCSLCLQPSMVDIIAYVILSKVTQFVMGGTQVLCQVGLEPKLSYLSLCQGTSTHEHIHAFGLSFNIYMILPYTWHSAQCLGEREKVSQDLLNKTNKVLALMELVFQWERKTNKELNSTHMSE